MLKRHYFGCAKLRVDEPWTLLATCFGTSIWQHCEAQMHLHANFSFSFDPQKLYLDGLAFWGSTVKGEVS